LNDSQRVIFREGGDLYLLDRRVELHKIIRSKASSWSHMLG
jgi:hypothetical protein